MPVSSHEWEPVWDVVKKTLDVWIANRITKSKKQRDMDVVDHGTRVAHVEVVFPTTPQYLLLTASAAPEIPSKSHDAK